MQHKDSPAFHRANFSEQKTASAASALKVGNQEQCYSPSSGTLAPSTKKGAPPSNTAPTNCKQPPSNFIKILRSGVDSLYLSYSGALFDEQNAVLSALKKTAQSPFEIDHASAMYRHQNHLFKVSDKGAGRHPYVLSDNAYRIQLASPTAKRIPLAYAQVKSDWLAHKGVQNSFDNLTSIIEILGTIDDSPKVSRSDHFVDFTCNFAFEKLLRMAWVCRARQFCDYWNGQTFTGFSFGLGGDISARLYNKTEEIKKSKKDYLKPLWKENGWDEQQDVWRLEFQFKRKVLSEHQITSVDDLLTRLGSLWIYATTQWLKLTIPSLTDDTKSRWPMHPLWVELVEADWGPYLNAQPKPIRPNNPPTDRYLYEAGLGTLTSFMARENIIDIFDANYEYIQQAKAHHSSRTEFTGSDLYTYAYEKASLKARKFNLPFGNHEQKAQDIRVSAQAEAYRKAKDGE
ncbi:hypothetical protein [Cycloclasticus sp.]|uniref:hypothetical protein n=1 Tax=Cycloclasticus sp. TaxID=2024830 RepID=UPI000C0D740F|nr:hypothetical protein [Cycloclasticus sp.]PHR51577.1 MAG: replication initiation factor [Cycloclasticus sp.]